MEKGNYIIELAGHIPVRNINFYIDACRAMNDANMQMLTEKDGRIANYPFHFLSFAFLEDLKLHGQGASYSLVEKVLDELAEHEIINAEFHGCRIRDRCVTVQDMAALFMGYSLASRGALLPIVPFPAHPAGFAARLASELSILLPPGGAFLTLNRSTRLANQRRY